MVSGSAAVSTRIAQMPISRPPRPPASPIRTLSTSNWRAMRQAPAPNAPRMAISRPRPAARISMRFATLAQAISNTNPTAPSRTSSGVRILPTVCSRNETTVAPHLLSKAGSSFCSCDAITFISARALAIVAPERRRATAER